MKRKNAAKKSSTSQIFQEVLQKINPPEIEIRDIEYSLEMFLQNLKSKMLKEKINAEVFVGGSFAKKTVIKKNNYDVDIFIRFDEKEYQGKELSEILRKVLDETGEIYQEVKGSREYFRIKKHDNFSFEIIPVLKVKNPKDSENITDLSYSHVKYINKKIKDKKILDEIKIAKAFCYATNTYGAESYIKGFSGYALELLVYHYRTFMNFAKAIAKSRDEKIIIDIEKFYKNKNEILMNLNSAKLQAPIILIDPTYKQRNVTAALSKETFEIFKKACVKFIKNPSVKSFELEKKDLKKIEENAIKKKQEFVFVEIHTERQEGDIAGTKMLKFKEFLEKEIERYFVVRESGFEYDSGQTSRSYFVVEKKKEIIFNGPKINDKKNVLAFKKMHKKTLVVRGKLMAKEKNNFSAKGFLEDWKKKNYGKMVDMSISEIKVLD